MNKNLIQSGQKISRLTIIREADPVIYVYGKRRSKVRMVECICDCGNITTTHYSPLKHGKTKSCGCLTAETAAQTSKKYRTTHGLRKHPLYGVYSSIIVRCYNIKANNYSGYGGRGVKMCDEWLIDFKAFYDWCMANGWKKGLEIDKDIIANKLGVSADLYSPERCLIVTPKENSNNRSNNIIVSVEGERLTLTQACSKLNMNYDKVRQRIRRYGYTFEEAIK